MKAKSYQTIEKEKISDLKFPSDEVLLNEAQIKERKEGLQKALKLANKQRHSIRIYFEDDCSPKMVETTLWGLTDERVILHQGIVIPIHRVHKVNVEGSLR